MTSLRWFECELHRLQTALDASEHQNALLCIDLQNLRTRTTPLPEGLDALFHAGLHHAKPRHPTRRTT